MRLVLLPSRLAVFYALCALLITAFAYFPGVHGTFLLDDYGTLPPLGQWGEIDTYAKLKEYVLGGFAGPTGRPVALFSFALNAQTWPVEPVGFLVTNILVHLINATLLFAVVYRVSKLAGHANALVLSSVAACIWMVHPMHVSTVLYVVQRMAMLEVTFNLLTLLAYFSFRSSIVGGGGVSRAVLGFMGVGFFALLAVGSKETAILIPLQLLLIELLLRWTGERIVNKPFLVTKWVVIYIPTLVVTFYLGEKWLHYFVTGESHQVREFTVAERQLTQFRVVGDYLGMFFIPKLQTSGVFHDAYPISKSLFSPVSTLIWLVAHSLLIVGAVIFRKRFAVVCFGVLWFYINHVLESTVIQLELKFEHRNYLPSIGLCVVLAWVVCCIPMREQARNVVIGAVLMLLMVVLYLRASLWGNPAIAAEVWVKENPNSYRALEHAARIFSHSSNGEQRAREYLQKAVHLSGNDPVVELKLYNYMCTTAELRPSDLESLVERFPKAPMNWQVGELFGSLLHKVYAGECSAVSESAYISLLQSALKNRRYRSTRIRLQLWDSLASANLLFGEKDKAVFMFLNELNYSRTPLGVIMKQAILLASHGELVAARTHLKRALAAQNNKKTESDYLITQAEEVVLNIERELYDENE